jgi:hypothetical protein
MQVEKVSYQINWQVFKPGASFFIPCLNPATAVQDILRVTKRLKFKIVTRVVIQEGVQGVRVWRV